MTTIIKCNDFVKRQTENSQYSHFGGSWEQLEKMVEANREKGVQGYKPGVFLVPLPAEGFFTSLVKITPETKLHAEFKARGPGEEPFINVTAGFGPLAPSTPTLKQPAKFVSVVIYSRDVLEEDSSASTNADYEIVSINCRSTKEETPMDPVTMMRNFLHIEGGTKGDFTAQQFAESIRFWSQHAMVHV